MTNAIRRHKRWTGSRWVPNMRGSLSTWNWKQRNAKPQHWGQIAPKPAPRAKANRSLSSARKRDASPAASSGGTYCQNSPCRHGWISSLDDGDCEGGEITNSCGPFVRRQSSEPRSHSRKESPRAARPTNCCCESATLMLKRKLRIVKRTPPAIGVCECCNTRFKSIEPSEPNG